MAENAETLHQLGIAAAQKGNLEIAAALIGRALALRPDWAEARSDLGNVFLAMGRLDQAIEHYRAAIAIRPDFAAALSNLSVALKRRGRFEEAVDAASQAAKIEPNSPSVFNSLGNALDALGRDDDAIAAYQRVLALNPESVESHLNIAHILLRRGDFARGFAEYEWRWRAPVSYGGKNDYPQPAWRGEPLEGTTILLHAEQGFGDAIQFVRFAPLVKARGARTIVECHPPLARLFKTAPGIDVLVAHGEPLPRFDVHCALMGLPLAMGTTIDMIPAPVPYLSADPDEAFRWRKRLGGGAALKVGLAWAGSGKHQFDAQRSMHLSQLAPLAEIKKVRFVSVQKGPATQQIGDAPQLGMIDWSAELHDFAATAAVIANLDLVLAVDTSVAHLAGAMGKEVWLMIPHRLEWRWLQNRTDSPWYPGMRIFEQTRGQGWETLIRSVAGALRTRVQ